MTAHADLPHHGPYGPVSRSLLDLRDSRLCRCWFCGEWKYGAVACGTCAAPATSDRKRESA